MHMLTPVTAPDAAGCHTVKCAKTGMIWFAYFGTVQLFQQEIADNHALLQTTIQPLILWAKLDEYW